MKDRTLTKIHKEMIQDEEYRAAHEAEKRKERDLLSNLVYEPSDNTPV